MFNSKDRCLDLESTLFQLNYFKSESGVKPNLLISKNSK